MGKERYSFESANKGAVEVSVVGEYRGHWSKDVDVSYAGADKSFVEIDSADEVVEWLVSEGIEFESRRSEAFNLRYIQNVMIERDMTEQQLLDEAASWSDEQIDAILYCVEP